MSVPWSDFGHEDTTGTNKNEVFFYFILRQINGKIWQRVGLQSLWLKLQVHITWISDFGGQHPRWDPRLLEG